jgi:EmrB/QacA subfamily drug resistance transporter
MRADDVQPGRRPAFVAQCVGDFIPTTPVSAARLHAIQDRRWLVLWVTCVGAFMSPLDFSAVSVALPDMGRDVHLSFAQALWVQAGYLLTYTLMLVPSGRIADQLGRLRVWRAGIAVFAVTSLLTGISVDTAWLLVSRSLQGIGAGMMTGTATALVSTVFPAGERGRAIGINVTAVYLGLSTGPLIGGLLVSSLGWRWVFFVNVPVAAITLLAARRLYDPDRRSGRPQIDIPGTVLLTAGLGCLLTALTFGADWGWSSTRVVSLFVVAAVALTSFAIVERFVPVPVIDLGLFRRSRVFAAANAAALLNYTAMFGSIALTAIALEVSAGKSPIATGAILIVQPAVMVCLSPFAGRLSDRIGSRLLCTGGMLLVALGLALLSIVPNGMPLTHVFPALVAIGVGMAMFSSPNTSAAMNSAPDAALGVAAGVLTTMRSLGQSMSIAVLGAITAAHLGAAGGKLLLGGSAPPGSAAAFLDGYRTAMAVGAGVAVIGALVSLTRGSRPPRVVTVTAPADATLSAGSVAPDR